MSMDRRHTPPELIDASDTMRSEKNTETDHPFFLDEQHNGSLILGGDSVWEGMKVIFPGQRPSFLKSMESTMMKELQDPVSRLVGLLATVTEQSFATGNTMYRGEDRDQLVKKIVKNLSSNDTYKDIIDSLALKSGKIADELVKFSVFLLSNASFLRAITGFVLDSMDSSQAPYRIEKFDAALREATSWTDQQERGAHLREQTARGRYTVQTEIDSSISDRLLFLLQTNRINLDRSRIIEKAVPVDKKEEVLSRESERTKRSESLGKRLLSKLKKPEKNELPTGKPLTEEDIKRRQEERKQAEKDLRKERLKVDYRATFAASVISSKIELMREATEFLTTDYGESKSKIPLTTKVIKSIKASFTANGYNAESEAAFLRLQEVYRFDSESDAVLDMLHQQFGLDRDSLTALSPKDVGKLITRAKSIVVHGFTRDEKHQYQELSFGSEPKHFVISVHGSPYTVEYYNPEAGFVTNEELVRTVQILERQHLSQEFDPVALEQRQLVAAVWTQLSYDTDKNAILTDPTLLEGFISSVLKKDVPDRKRVIADIRQSIMQLTFADFSVSIGAQEVPEFGADDHSGEMLNLVFGGQHIDLSDNLSEVLSEDVIDDNSLLKDHKPVVMRMNGGYDHGCIDGREANQTNSELSQRATERFLKPSHIEALRSDNQDTARYSPLMLGFTSEDASYFDQEKVITENYQEYVVSLPAVPEALARSPKKLAAEFTASLREALAKELEVHLEELKAMNSNQLMQNAEEIMSWYVATSTESLLETRFPEDWKDFLYENPDIRQESPNDIQRKKDEVYDLSRKDVRADIADWLNGRSVVIQSLAKDNNFTSYDFSKILNFYNSIDVDTIKPSEFAAFSEQNSELVQAKDRYDILTQLKEIKKLRKVLRKRRKALMADKKNALGRDLQREPLQMSDKKFEEYYARINNPELAQIEEVWQVVGRALNQLNQMFVKLLYDIEVQEKMGIEPLIETYKNMNLDRISWVTSVHFAESAADILTFVKDGIRDAQKIMPTSRNIAATNERINFHTLTGHESVKNTLSLFAEHWGGKDKNVPGGKEAAVDAYKELVQNYFSVFSMPFQAGVDQANKQVSNTSVLSAGTTKVTQWLLEKTLAAFGNKKVLTQYRSKGLVSAVHSKSGVEGRKDLVDLSRADLTPEEHAEAVIAELHGQSSFHTALPEGVVHAHGVTFNHLPESAAIHIKERISITPEHLDQIAQELLGQERSLSRQVVEKVVPGFYFKKLTIEQQKEAVRIAKKESAQWVHSFYRWYIFINVMNKTDIPAVEAAHDEWVSSDSRKSFSSYFMDTQLTQYGLSDETLDFYKNGPSEMR